MTITYSDKCTTTIIRQQTRAARLGNDENLKATHTYFLFLVIYFCGANIMTSPSLYGKLSEGRMSMIEQNEIVGSV